MPDGPIDCFLRHVAGCGPLNADDSKNSFDAVFLTMVKDDVMLCALRVLGATLLGSREQAHVDPVNIVIGQPRLLEGVVELINVFANLIFSKFQIVRTARKPFVKSADERRVFPARQEEVAVSLAEDLMFVLELCSSSDRDAKGGKEVTCDEHRCAQHMERRSTGGTSKHCCSNGIGSPGTGARDCYPSANRSGFSAEAVYRLHTDDAVSFPYQTRCLDVIACCRALIYSRSNDCEIQAFGVHDLAVVENRPTCYAGPVQIRH